MPEWTTNCWNETKQENVFFCLLFTKNRSFPSKVFVQGVILQFLVPSLPLSVPRESQVYPHRFPYFWQKAVRSGILLLSVVVEKPLDWTVPLFLHQGFYLLQGRSEATPPLLLILLDFFCRSPFCARILHEARKHSG